MRNAAVLAFALLLLAIPTFAADGAVACATDWGYGPDNGPDRWGQLQPAYEACDAGPFQSPVVLGTGSAAPYPLSVSYSPAMAPINLQHTAHALNVFTLGQTNFLAYGNVRALLTKFHFHSAPEHQPAGNAKGELHLVHFQNGAGYVIAIFIDNDGTDNDAIGELLTRLPTAECTSVNISSFNVSKLLPDSIAAWTMYSGSLTTPPCSGGVTFFVMKDHLHISPTQWTALQQLSEGKRPPQLLNGRTFVTKN